MGKLSRWALCLLLSLAPVALAAQQAATVSGRVTDETGAPIASASVFIPAMNIGTLTRADGTYTLSVPANRMGTGRSVQVTAQVLGRRSQSQTVQLAPGGSATLNFQLQTDVLQLEGIVATGIGQTTTRERLGVSISSVSAEEITKVPTTNVVNAMAAKAPGVEITSSAGDPGASAYIRIRGTKTISGSGQPLFVVDGVPINNQENFLPASVQYGESSDLAGTIVPNRASDINPADIASIEILKGAAASAIYGARAANGVVLITTKSAQAGQTRATLTTTMATDEVNKAIPLQRRFGHGTGGVNNKRGLRAWGGEISGETYDHWGELFETGQMIDSNLAVSGGSERTSYYLSVGRVTHDGVIVGGNDHYNKTTARLKASHELVPGLKLGGNFAYSAVDGSFIQKGSNLSGLLLGGLRTPPDFNNNPYLTDRGFHRSYTSPNPQSADDAGVFDNPFWTIHQNRSISEVGRTFGNLSVDYAPLPGLTFNYTLGLDYSNDNQRNWLPLGNYTYTPGYLAEAQFLNQQLNHDLIGTLSRSIGEMARGSMTLGYNRSMRRLDRFFVEGQDFIAPGVYTLNNTVIRTPNQYRERIHTESFFGQTQLELADQLFLTAALRNDGFSTFGESEKRHWFPKLSVAWNLSETLGLQENPLLGFAKLRAAWGQAGNEPPAYGTIFGYSADNVDSGWNDFLRTTLGGAGGLYSDATKAQPDLKPERTTELEVGFDLTLLRDRASVSATYYDARTEDAILSTPLAPSTGFFAQLQNAAEIQNRGYELSLDVRPVQTRTLGWSVGLTFTDNENEVLSLGDPDREYVDMGGFIGTAAVKGYPIGVMRGNDFYRCGQLGTNAPSEVQSACQGAPAGAVYIGANGQPVLDPEVRVIGNPQPDWTAGIRSAVTLFDRVEISALVDVKQGGDVWNGTRGALYSYGTHKDTEIRGLKATYGSHKGVPVVGPGKDVPMTFNETWFRGLGSGFGPVGAQFIEDGSYAKLREVALSYSVPAEMARRLGMGGIDLRLAGRNLKTWTDYTGIDPETNLTGTSEIRGQDYFNNPQTRQLILTVGLTR